MTDEKPPVLVWGDAIQVWSDRWRKADPIDVDAAVAEGGTLADPVIAWAEPLLANAAVRPPRPQHLLLLRAMLGSWTILAWRLRKRLPPGQETSPFAVAVDRACATIRSLAAAQAAIEATLPPKRDYMTQEEARNAIQESRMPSGYDVQWTGEAKAVLDVVNVVAPEFAERLNDEVEGVADDPYLLADILDPLDYPSVPYAFRWHAYAVTVIVRLSDRIRLLYVDRVTIKTSIGGINPFD